MQWAEKKIFLHETGVEMYRVLFLVTILKCKVVFFLSPTDLKKTNDIDILYIQLFKNFDVIL